MTENPTTAVTGTAASFSQIFTAGDRVSTPWLIWLGFCAQKTLIVSAVLSDSHIRMHRPWWLITLDWFSPPDRFERHLRECSRKMGRQPSISYDTERGWLRRETG